MDDYTHCLMAYLNTIPALTLSIPSLPLAVSHTLSALSCPAPEIVRIALDTLAKLSTLVPSSPPLQPIFQQYGKAIVSLVLQGVVQDFPEDGMEEVEKILITTVAVGGGESEGWAVEALSGVPGHVLPASDRQAFVTELQE
jgi:transportin-3